VKGCREVRIKFDSEQTHVKLRLFTGELGLDLIGEGGKLEQEVLDEGRSTHKIRSSSGIAAVHERQFFGNTSHGEFPYISPPDGDETTVF